MTRVGSQRHKKKKIYIYIYIYIYTCFLSPFTILRVKSLNKLKVTVKVNLTLKQAMNFHRANRGIALLFPNYSSNWGWVANAATRPL